MVEKIMLVWICLSNKNLSDPKQLKRSFIKSLPLSFREPKLSRNRWKSSGWKVGSGKQCFSLWPRPNGWSTKPESLVLFSHTIHYMHVTNYAFDYFHEDPLISIFWCFKNRIFTAFTPKRGSAMMMNLHPSISGFLIGGNAVVSKAEWYVSLKIFMCLTVDPPGWNFSTVDTGNPPEHKTWKIIENPHFGKLGIIFQACIFCKLHDSFGKCTPRYSDDSGKFQKKHPGSWISKESDIGDGSLCHF